MSRDPDFNPDIGQGNSVRASIVSGDGTRLTLTVHGAEGPLVILVHGWSCGAAFWRNQIAPLASRFRVAVLDLPGHGEAPAARAGGVWSMEGFGGDVVAVADGLDADEVILVGHSMGGAVAVEAALRLGSRCRMLVGVDTFTEAAFYAPRPGDEIAARLAGFRGDFGGTMRGMIASITGAETDPALVASIGEAMAATDATAALGVLEALLGWDIAARWPHLAVPAIAINSAMLAARNELIDLPGLDVRLMERVGHFPMLEDPAAFNALLMQILPPRA